jgi:hypothetical protein
MLALLFCPKARCGVSLRDGAAGRLVAMMAIEDQDGDGSEEDGDDDDGAAGGDEVQRLKREVVEMEENIEAPGKEKAGDEKKRRLEALEIFDQFMTHVNVVSDDEEPHPGSRDDKSQNHDDNKLPGGVTPESSAEGQDDKVPKEQECPEEKPQGVEHTSSTGAANDKLPKQRRVRRTAAQIAEDDVRRQKDLDAAREALDKFVIERGLTEPTAKGHAKGRQPEQTEEAPPAAEGKGTRSGAEARASASAVKINDAAGKRKGQEGAAGGKGKKASAKAAAAAKALDKEESDDGKTYASSSAPQAVTTSAEPSQEPIGSKRPIAEGKPKAAAKAKVKAAIANKDGIAEGKPLAAAKAEVKAAIENDEGEESKDGAPPSRAARGSAEILESSPIGEGSEYLFVQQMRCLIEFA